MYALLTALLCLPSWADTITIDGTTHTNVLVRESGTMHYVQFPDGELRSIPKSSNAVSNVEMATDQSERDRLHDQWRAARAAKNGESPPAPDATQEERYPLAIAAVREAVERARQPVVLRLKGTKKPAAVQQSTSIPAELLVDGTTYTMSVNRERLAQALQTYTPKQPLNAAVRNGTIRVTREQVAPRAHQQPQTRYYNVPNAAQTLPKAAVQNPGGGGFAGGGAGGFAGGGAGGAGGAGAAGGLGGAGFGGGPQIFNISDLFFTIDDRSVGETLNPISAMYGVR